jgi:hypothetical protein
LPEADRRGIGFVVTIAGVDDIDIRIVREGYERLLSRVAPGLFDNPVDASLLAEFLRDSRHHLAQSCVKLDVVRPRASASDPKRTLSRCEFIDALEIRIAAHFPGAARPTQLLRSPGRRKMKCP